MIDYIIVGSGLAGIAFAETALQSNRSILMFDNHSQNSSRIAGGLYNPVILKRFSGIAYAQQHLDVMNAFYKSLEAKLKCQFNFQLPVLRKFHSVEEQNNWFMASDKIAMANFLSDTIIETNYQGIDSPFDYGEVLQTGFVDTKNLLLKYHQYLQTQNILVSDSFKYQLLEVRPDTVAYGDTEAKHVIFAEGFGIHANPYFNFLPLDGTKGELFIIKAPNLKLDVIVNTSVFILPLGDDLYKVGATYNWEDKTDQTTSAGKAELVARISEILNCNFEIIEHLAGVRPTVKDRKALVGTHHKYKNLHILNGLGTRGVMLGPAMAKTLFGHIEYGSEIPREINITRFKGA